MSAQQIYIDASNRNWISLLEFSPHIGPLKTVSHEWQLRRGDLYHLTCWKCGQAALMNTFVDAACRSN